MYRWNNDKNARKKRTARWKTVFESESAKYIQYVCSIRHGLRYMDGC